MRAVRFDRVGGPERTAADASGAAGSTVADAPLGEVTKSSQHTMTAADLASPWRGPLPHKDAASK